MSAPEKKPGWPADESAEIININANRKLFDDFLTQRQLTTADAEVMGLKLLIPKSELATEISRQFKIAVFQPSVLIPYPGHPNFARVRALKGDGPKYVGPSVKGVSPLYLAAVEGLDWDDIKVDVSIPLFIPEGEIKGYMGCKHHIVTVSIGGVTMYASLFNSGFIWDGRETYICFDHDARQARGSYKPSVQGAINTTCTELIARGAKVKIINIGLIERLDPAQKWGLDDALKAGVTKDELCATATDPEKCQKDLAEMLTTCVYVTGTDHTHIYNIDDKSRKTATDFHQTHIEKRVWVQKGEGNNGTYQYLSRVWIVHKSRLTVSNYGFDPKLPPGIHNNLYNLWTPYPDFPQASPEYAAEVRRDWEKFIVGLFGEEELALPFGGTMPAWKWVALWAAHGLNQPWEKTTQAILVKTGLQGIGKGTFGSFLVKLAGEHGMTVRPDNMKDKFNKELEGKVFIQVEELDVVYSLKAGQINNLITAETIPIEPKGKDKFYVPNYLRWFMDTNVSTPIRLSQGQRRVLVLSTARSSGDGKGEWGKWVSEVIRGKYRDDPVALGVIREWFNELWLAEGMGWNPAAPVPETEASLDLIDSSEETQTTMARTLYELGVELEGKWLAVLPDTYNKNRKLFGELKQLVRDSGGRCGSKNIKEDGKTTRAVIFALEGELPEANPDSSGKLIFMVDAEEVRARGGKVALMLNDLKQDMTHKGGSRY